MTERIKINISMEVTIPQALALQAMFEYWNTLASVGSSRKVGFYVDGDGNFKPRCQMITYAQIPELTDEMRKIAIVSDDDGNVVYDFDGIAWILEEQKERS